MTHLRLVKSAPPIEPGDTVKLPDNSFGRVKTEQWDGWVRVVNQMDRVRNYHVGDLARVEMELG